MAEKWRKVGGGSFERWEKVDDGGALALVGGALIWFFIIAALMNGCS